MGEQYRFEPTGEVRFPLDGEWFLAANFPDVLQATSSHTREPRPIYRRVPHDPDTAAEILAEELVSIGVRIGIIDGTQPMTGPQLSWLAEEIRTYCEATAAEVACLTTRIKELESTLESIRDGYDHESDAHRYNNGACRKCMAAEALKGTT